jgi:hypothetical protein
VPGRFAGAAREEGATQAIVAIDARDRGDDEFFIGAALGGEAPAVDGWEDTFDLWTAEACDLLQVSAHGQPWWLAARGS